MFVDQLSVFIENKPGRLQQLTRLLADNGINLLTLSIADTKDYGILRTITTDNDKAIAVLRAGGFTVSCTKLVGAEVADVPGGLAGVLEVIREEGINIEYVYSYARTSDKNAIILMKVENSTEAVSLLEKHGIKIIDKVN